MRVLKFGLTFLGSAVLGLAAEGRFRFSIDDAARQPPARGASVFVIPDGSDNSSFQNLEPYFLLYGTFRADTRESWTLRIKRDGERWFILYAEAVSGADGQPRIQDLASREVDKEDANLLYAVWLNLLLEVRYGPRLGPAGRGITTHHLSAYKGTIGYMGAVSLSHDQYPAILLLREIADELRSYVLKPLSSRRRLPVELTQKIENLDVLLEKELRR